MPLPTPELMDEVKWVFAGCVEEFACGERNGLDMEDAAGDVDEGDYQDQFQRIDDVVGQL